MSLNSYWHASGWVGTLLLLGGALLPSCGESDDRNLGRSRQSLEDSLIIGGEEVHPGGWPWQAQIEVTGYPHWCGGSLLNEEWVLTAAHCVEYPGLTASDFTVRLGLHQRSDPGPNVQMRAVDQIESHPDYGVGGTYNNDVALLHLNTPVTFTEHVKPIRLATVDPADGEETAVTGWGRTSWTDPAADVLMEAVIPIVNRSVCDQAFSVDVTTSMICAGFVNGSSGGCKGDSGGPLVIPSDGVSGWEQVGVVSWGAYGCSSYTVFARVSELEGWITSVAGPTPVLGDATGDGCVDMADYNLVNTEWGYPVPPADPDADVTQDGWVDDDDWMLVVQNWGVGC